MRLRGLVAIVAMAWTSVVAPSAQESASGAGVRPLPPIGLPLPRIGLPLPPLGLRTPEPTPAVAPGGPIKGRHHRPGRFPPPIILLPAYPMPVVVQPIVVGASGVGACASGRCAPASQPASQSSGRSARGRLRVLAEPRDAVRLYVDGNFVGGSLEAGSDLELEPGLHTLDIRADGYQPVQEALTVTGGSRLVYRAALEPNPPRSSEPPAPVTFYLVPGCYAGDVPPAQVQLPAGCDPGKARSFPR